KWVSRLISPILELLRPIPPIAWIPLAILWFGIGNNPAYFLVFLGAFFPIFSNTYLGVSSVEETYKRAAYSLGATKKEIITDIILPASMPQIFTGLKIGLGVGWMVVIAAELVGAQSGLGYMIQLNRFLLNSPEIITGMITIGVIGFLLNLLITKIEKMTTPWNQKI
ncbi:nitrate ABC transporter permease, partial [Candidatus Campbellbacteria bacterium CG22_combo_CG10-13_8_21_14_all_43_18]